MPGADLIKNIEFSKAVDLAGLVEYQDGQVVSRTFSQSPNLSLTLFAFDKGEGLSAHSAPGDAMVHVLDGTARITIDGRPMDVSAGQVVVMPADVPHAVDADQRFKMLLILVRKPVAIG